MRRILGVLLLAGLLLSCVAGCSQVEVHAKGDTQTSVGIRGGTSF